MRHGYHALALHETRAAFAPVLWDSPAGEAGRVEQVWFRGAHGDIGGQLGDHQAARPLANIPLVWMLDRAEGLGLPLPPNWRLRFPCSAEVPMLGTWTSWGKFFLFRARRRPGSDRSEVVHHSVIQAVKPPRRVWYLPGFPRRSS